MEMIFEKLSKKFTSLHDSSFSLIQNLQSISVTTIILSIDLESLSLRFEYPFKVGSSDLECDVYQPTVLPNMPHLFPEKPLRLQKKFASLRVQNSQTDESRAEGLKNALDNPPGVEAKLVLMGSN